MSLREPRGDRTSAASWHGPGSAGGRRRAPHYTRPMPPQRTPARQRHPRRGGPRAQPARRLGGHPARRPRASSPACRAAASRAWRSTRSTPRGSAATSRACRPTRASSWARWTSRTSTTSTACRRRSRSTRRPPAATRARRWRPSPRSTTTCACCSPASASRTARSAAGRSPARASSRSPTRSWRCPRAPASWCWRRSCAGARASTGTCSSTSAREGFSRVAVDGDDVRARRGPAARQEVQPHDRGRRRPAGHARRPAPAAHRQPGDGDAAGRRPGAHRGGARATADAARRGPTPRSSPARSTARRCPSSRRAPSRFNSPHGACPQCTGLGFTPEVDPELVVDAGAHAAPTGAILPWTDRTTDYYDLLLGVIADAARDRPGPAVDEAAGAPPHPAARRPAAARAHVPGAAPQGRRQLGLVRGRHPAAAPPARDLDVARRCATAWSSSCRCARARRAAARGSSPRRWPSPWPAATSTSVCLLSVERRAGLLRRAGAERHPGVHRGARHPGDPRAPALPRRRRRRLPRPWRAPRARSRAARRSASGWPPRSARAWSGVLYILDEPSIGLHQRDNRKLIGTLERLRDQGNTVLVVEHDEDMIRSADHVIDMGPGAGEHGGRVVAAGVGGRHRGRAGLGHRRVPVGPPGHPGARRRGARRAGGSRCTGAREHNLRGIDVGFPVGALTCVTGRVRVGQEHPRERGAAEGARRPPRAAGRARPGAHDRIDGLEHIDKVIDIDQSPIGRTPRSNPATYTGPLRPHPPALLEDPGRAGARLLARAGSASTSRAAAARPARATARSPSRCTSCRTSTCPCEVCGGKRYNRETLDGALRRAHHPRGAGA